MFNSKLKAKSVLDAYPLLKAKRLYNLDLIAPYVDIEIAISKLDKPQRKMLKLIHLYGLQQQDAALVLNIPKTTAHTLYNAALERFAAVYFYEV